MLLIGCGDIARRVAKRLQGRYRLFGLARTDAQAIALREWGVRPLRGDLDHLHSLARLGISPDIVFHFAPPPAEGAGDPRGTRLWAALARGRMLPRRLVYISTSGVYGDQQGALVSEVTPQHPRSARGRRRQAAERGLRQHFARAGVRLALLRAPGIYAADRLPLERLRANLPLLLGEEDIYTNHIHADDLARAAIAAARLGRGGRAFNVCDDAHWLMSEWFDRLADAYDLPRAPRVTRLVAEKTLTPMQLSFLGESRRLSNLRMKRELRLRLEYPSPEVLLERVAPKRRQVQGRLL